MTLQYRGGGEPSDYNLASTFVSNHRKLEGVADHAFKLVALPVKQLHRYLSVAIREKGVLNMYIRQFVQNAAHPPEQPGHLVSNCPICATGTDVSQLDPPPGVEGTTICHALEEEHGPAMVQPAVVLPSRICTLLSPARLR